MNGIDHSQMQQVEEMKRQVLVRVLDKEAYERLARVRIANPQLASQLELYLMQLFQSGKLQERITDSKLKEILLILSEKRKVTIKRK